MITRPRMDTNLYIVYSTECGYSVLDRGIAQQQYYYSTMSQQSGLNQMYLRCDTFSSNLENLDLDSIAPKRLESEFNFYKRQTFVPATSIARSSLTGLS